MNHSLQLLITPRAYGSFLDRLYNASSPVSPRGQLTHEVVGACATLRNPIDRIVAATARKNNIAFGFAEWLAFMTGIDSTLFFTQFISDFGKFSSDGIAIDGAYGTRINYTDYAYADDGKLVSVDASQLKDAEDKLRADPDTRQAVLALYDRGDLRGGGGKNTPCTLNLQFLVRDGELHMITNMRSSDAVRGLTYDLVVFTMVQEFMARRLGLRLGQYLHRAGSLHIYDRDLLLTEKLLESPRWPLLMMAMPKLEYEDIELLRSITLEGLWSPNNFQSRLASERNAWSSPEARDYLTQIAAVMVSYAARKLYKDASVTALSLVKDRTLRFVLKPRLKAADAPDSRGAP